MSGDKISLTRPTMEINKDIINNLTSDLESSCLESEPNLTAEKPTIDLDNGDSETSYDDFRDSSPISDLIDEEALKSEQATLTEEEKIQRKIDADKLKIEGNVLFKNEQFYEASETYTLGLRTCPVEHINERSILYANRAACKTKMSLTESAIEDCAKAIELNPKYVKAYLRRAQLYEQTDKLDESLEDYKKILELDPDNSQARAATYRLPPIIQERNEKLKTEMLGKLKDLGNMILRPFGLSTNNFEVQQDPSSGGYSMKFNQNPK